MNAFLKYFEQLKTVFQNLSPPQRIFSAGSFLVIVAALGYVAYNANKVEYTTLYSKLSQEDMGKVVEMLKAKKVPYQLSEGGSVSVPKEQLYESRLLLAKEGVPKGSGIGFEIFDQQKLGSSEFVQKINYQRALQGELIRTINEMNAVEESRVHLVIPEQSVFMEDQKIPTASVILKLHGSAQLDPNEVQGIVNLVASAVPGLKEENVTIVSTDGKILFKKGASDTPVQISSSQMEMKSRMEEEIRRKLQSMLEQVLGANRVITRVAADLDFSQVKIAEDTYDPDSSVIRSQQRSIENADKESGGPKGNPDAPVNLESKLLQSTPQPAAKGAVDTTASAQQKGFNRQHETVNYEINHVNRNTIRSPGTVKKLSVAVVVDGAYEMKADKEGQSKQTFVGRTPEELKSVEEMVKKAMGFDEARGDQVVISNTPFAPDMAEIESMAKAENQWLKLLKSNQKIIFNLLLTLATFIFILSFMRKLNKIVVRGEPQAEAPVVALPPTPEEELEALLTPEGGFSPRKHIGLLVQRNPQRAAEVIRSWLREEV